MQICPGLKLENINGFNGCSSLAEFKPVIQLTRWMLDFEGARGYDGSRGALLE